MSEAERARLVAIVASISKRELRGIERALENSWSEKHRDFLNHDKAEALKQKLADLSRFCRGIPRCTCAADADECVVHPEMV